MAVEVVGADVQQRGNRQARIPQAFKLETRQFENVGVALVGQEVERWTADVAAHRDVASIRRQQPPDERRDGALAVGAGDADDRRLRGVEEDLDVAGDRHAHGAGGAQQRVVRGNARARQHPIRDAQSAAPAFQPEHLEAGEVAARRRQTRRLGARVEDKQAIPLGQMPDARVARCPEAEDDRRGHRSFNVARPASTSTKVTIHMRTMTRGSGQPSSSKW